MPRRVKTTRTDRANLRIIAAEQLLIDAIPEITGQRVLCTSLGRGQFAAAAADASPEIPVICHFFDTFLAEESRQISGAGRGNLTFICTPDFPAGEFDVVAIPVSTTGDAELTRDLLQAGHQALRHGGRLLSSSWSKEDQWLHAELKKLFSKVTRRVTEGGVLYIATKTAPLKKIKNFTCEFAFRDQARLINAVSRPGVFSHRSIDAGARALLNTIVINEGFRVLDIGCGSGIVGLAAALRASEVAVTCVDSHARAIECTRRGAELNALASITTLLNADGECGEPGTFDVVVGNPPYYSDFRIAEIFLLAALRALKPGGRAYMVTKSSNWYEQRFGEEFDDVSMHPHKTYIVAEGVQRSSRV